jgi:hypothetical protein
VPATSSEVNFGSFFSEQKINYIKPADPSVSRTVNALRNVDPGLTAAAASMGRKGVLVDSQVSRKRKHPSQPAEKQHAAGGLFAGLRFVGCNVSDLTYCLVELAAFNSSIFSPSPPTLNCFITEILLLFF